MPQTPGRPELTPIISLPALYNPRDLALIRRTVALDTTDDEFALFIHWARSLRLDPLRRRKSAASRSSPRSKGFGPSPPARAITAPTRTSPASWPTTRSSLTPIPGAKGRGTA